MFLLHHGNNIECNIEKDLYWHEGNLSYTSIYLTVTLRNYASSEITNF